MALAHPHRHSRLDTLALAQEERSRGLGCVPAPLGTGSVINGFYEIFIPTCCLSFARRWLHGYMMRRGSTHV